MGSNYDKMKDQARQLFLTYDQDRMIAKFQLAHTDKVIRVRFAGGWYEIDRGSGVVTREKTRCARDVSGGEDASFEAAMSIYDILCHSQERPALSGEWVTIQSLYGIKGGKGHGSLLDRYAKLIGHRTERMLEICAEMGGRRSTGKEDAGSVIPVFDFFPVYLQFWESDEDFPAQLQFLLDKNAADFVYYETMWYMIMHICGRIEKGMGAPSGSGWR